MLYHVCHHLPRDSFWWESPRWQKAITVTFPRCDEDDYRKPVRPSQATLREYSSAHTHTHIHSLSLSCGNDSHKHIVQRSKLYSVQSLFTFLHLVNYQTVKLGSLKISHNTGFVCKDCKETAQKIVS